MITLLCLGVLACADARKDTRPISTTASSIPLQKTITGDYDYDDYTNAPPSNDGDNDDDHTPKDRDNDSDNPTDHYYDKDDNQIRFFGHSAGTSDRHAIITLVKRYYATAVIEDGSTACKMIIVSLARSLPEDLGRPPGPPYLRGKTCATIMSKLFKQSHRQLTAYANALKVTSVRVDGDHGVAILSFKTLPTRQIRLAREGGAWKLEGLLDGELS
jgi:hypothetical protein